MLDQTRLHLKIVGCFLEHHKLYRKPHLNAVKHVVTRILSERFPEPASLSEMMSILCFDDIPLFSENAVRRALNSLFRGDDVIEQVDKKQRVYRLKEQLPPAEDSFVARLEDAWGRHLQYCDGFSFAQFLEFVARLFSKFGCDAYATLNAKDVSRARIADIVSDVGVADKDRREVVECLEQFVLSTHPRDAELKVQLASTYALLRMNGAGNWEKDELRVYFESKRFLLDTNVLFEIASQSINQIMLALDAIRELGGSLFVGRETIQEFETALRNSSELVVEIVQSGIDLKRLREDAVLSADWVTALVEDDVPISGELIAERIDRLVAQVEGVLEQASVEVVHLERSAPDSARAKRVERIQELVVQSRPFQKHDAVAYHDALLLEAVEAEPTLADVVLSRDRSLARVRHNGKPMAAMMDDVVAYALLGTAREEQMAGLLNHFIVHDLHPEAPLLDLEDIRSLARMEGRLLDSPPIALRRAAKQVGRARYEALERGEHVEDEQIARVFVNTLSDYREDQRIAAIEAERANQAEAKAAKLETELVGLRQVRDDAEKLRERLDEQDQRITDAERDRAVSEARYEHEKKERDREGEQSRKRQDWNLLLVIFLGAAGVALVLSFKWTAAILVIVSALVTVWVSRAQNLADISLRAIAGVVALLGVISGIVEKWPTVSSVIHHARSPATESSQHRATPQEPRK